jgi:hypothetical protein
MKVVEYAKTNPHIFICCPDYYQEKIVYSPFEGELL